MKRIAPIIAAVVIIVLAFTAPIITFEAFGDRVGSDSLYSAALDAYDAKENTIPITIAVLLIAASVVGLALAGFGVLGERYGVYAALAALASFVPLIVFHANATRIEFFGFELASAQLGYGAFLPAAVGLAFLVFVRFVYSRS